MRRLVQGIGSLLRRAVRLLLALVILFEEWGWEPLSRLMSRIGQLPVFKQLEVLIAKLPPYAALVVFLVPGLLLLPVKILAVWLISIGRAKLGLIVILLAKFIGTAVVARLFQLTQPALMQLGWFVRLHGRWTNWKQGLLAWVRTSAAWRSARAFKLRLRRRFRPQ